MQARYLAGRDRKALLDPDGRAWQRLRPVRLSLLSTGRHVRVVDHVSVAALHDGQRLAFRLEWRDATESRTVADIIDFPDAAAILLPVAPGASAVTMGAPGAPVNAWYWRADEDGLGRQIVAEGFGTTRTLDRELVKGRGLWKEGRWRVVIARPLHVESAEPVVQLTLGKTASFAVAVWEGSRAERAGVKSFSRDWRELHLEAVPAGRR